MARGTVAASAKLARIGRSTLYRWIAEGLVHQYADGTVDQVEVEETRERFADHPRRVALDLVTASGTR